MVSKRSFFFITKGKIVFILSSSLLFPAVMFVYLRLVGLEGSSGVEFECVKMARTAVLRVVFWFWVLSV